MKISTKQTLVLAAAALLASGGAQAEEIKFKTSGGLKWETSDGSTSGQFGGRVMVDSNYYDEDVVETHENGLEFRRLRLFGAAKYLDYAAKVQIDFADSDVALKDAWISKKAFGGTIKGGHFKQPFGLEELTSSKYITFMERAFSGIPASRKIGLAYSYATDYTTFTVSGYDPDSLGDEHGETNDGLGFGGRFTWAPHVDKGNVTHFGIAAAREQDMDRYRVRPRIGHLAERTVILDVQDQNGVDVTKAGLEAALVRGPFSVQAEYQLADVGSGVADEAVNAYYIYTSWFLTGEVRPYKGGSFGRVKPINDGAWEIALRYEGADNDDSDGEAEAITAGLNYYANPHVRYMFNVVRGDLTGDVSGLGFVKNDKPTAFLARWQLDF